MTRLEQFLNPDSGYEADYPEDLKMLKDGIPQIQALFDCQIELLYREYSEDTHCAGWLCLNQDGVKDFAYWLNEEI